MVFYAYGCILYSLYLFWPFGIELFLFSPVKFAKLQNELPSNSCCACVVTSPCDSSPCQNGATCIAYGQAFSCTCAVGYAGTKCDKSKFRQASAYPGIIVQYWLLIIIRALSYRVIIVVVNVSVKITVVCPCCQLQTAAVYR
jgi:hypothetical protein